MDDKTYFLITFIGGGIIILAGLAVTIFGLIKRKKLWIAMGVLIAMIPTIVSFIAKQF